MFGKVGNPTHHGWTEDDSTDDFGNDSRLTNPFEEPTETLREADDDEQLDAEECDGLQINYVSD